MPILTIAPEAVQRAIRAAETLAQYQIGHEGEVDSTGFSNADIGLGLRLAAIVSDDPDNLNYVKGLAALLRKYTRQAQPMVGIYWAALMDLASQDLAGDYSRKLRDDARVDYQRIKKAKATVEVNMQQGTPPSFVFTWQGFDGPLYDALKGAGCRYNKVNGKATMVCFGNNLKAAVDAAKNLGRTVIIDFDVEQAAKSGAVTEATSKNFAVVKLTDVSAGILWTPYHQAGVNAIKDLPLAKRNYDPYAKVWYIRFEALPQIIEAFGKLQIDAAPLVEVYDKKKDSIVVEAPVEEVVPVGGDLREKYKSLIERMKMPPDEHQLVGLDFLVHNKGAILADDMGLGKTITAIMGCEQIRKGAAVLVVVEKVGKFPFQREINKFFDGIPTHVVVSSTTTKEDILECYAQGGYIIINYDILKNFHEVLTSLPWKVQVYDEATAIKNITAQRTKLVLGYQATKKFDKKTGAIVEKPAIVGLLSKTEYAWLMTGTPLANRTKDLFNLLKAIKHPLGRHFKPFALRYCEGYEDQWGLHADGASNIEELRAKTANVILRRTKEEVFDLPPKRRNFVPVESNDAEYNRVMREYAEKIKRGEMKYTDCVLAVLNKVRYANAISKIDSSIERVTEALEQGNQVILFSNYTEPIEKVFDACRAFNPVILNGKVNDKHRLEAQDEFQAGKSKLFCANLKAGGKAITLTRANYVCFNDLSFEPYLLTQGEDRAYRRGTDHPVLCEYMVAHGTIDEDLGGMLEEKFNAIATFEGRQNESVFRDFVRRLGERLGVAQAQLEAVTASLPATDPEDVE